MIRFFYRQTIVQQLVFLLAFILLCIWVYSSQSYTNLETILSIRIAQAMNEGFLLYKDIDANMNPLFILFVYLISKLGISLLILSVIGVVFSLFSLFTFILILEKHDIFNERTSLPLVVVLLLFLLEHDFFYLKPEIMGLSFVVISLDTFIDHFKTQVDDHKRHLMGFYIGLASLFYSPFCLLLPLVILYLASSSSISLRSYLLLTVGFILPFALIGLFFVFTDVGVQWLEPVFNNLLSITISDFNSVNLYPWYGFAAFTVVAFFAMGNLFTNNLQGSFRMFMFLWFVVFFLLKLFVDRQLSLLLIVLPCMYFFPFLVFSIKRYWVKELCFVILLSSFFILKCLTHTDSSELVKKFKKNSEKWMVLDADMAVYIEKRASSPYFDWKNNQKLFLNPNDYKNVAMLHQHISRFEPCVIYDPNQYLKLFESYIPLLENKYKKNHQSNTYTLIK